MKEIQLGNKVKDKVSGLTGIAVARTEFLNGCIRFTIQPEAKKDGTIPSECWIDDKQLVIVGKGVTVEMQRTGGPTSMKVPKGLKA